MANTVAHVFLIGCGGSQPHRTLLFQRLQSMEAHRSRYGLKLLFRGSFLFQLFAQCRFVPLTPMSRIPLLLCAPQGGAHHSIRRGHSSLKELFAHAWQRDLCQNALVQSRVAALRLHPSDIEPHPIDNSFGPYLCLTGLAIVCAGTEYIGPLTQWHEEEVPQWELLGRPLDAFSLNVVAAMAFPCPLKVPSHRQRSCKRRLQQPPAVVWDVVFGASLNPGQHAAHEFLQMHGALQRDAWLVELPAVLSALVSKTAWKRLLFRASDLPRVRGHQCSLLPEYPTAQSLRRWASLAESLSRKRDAECQDSLDSLVGLRDKLLCTADRLRQWAPTILRGAPPDEEEVTRSQLEHCIGRYGCLTRYKASSLVQAILGGSLLRNGSNLHRMLQRAVPLIVPKVLQGHILASLDAKAGDGTLQVPKNSSLKRHRFTVDCALSLCFRDQFDACQQSLVVYMWADSSPMGKRNWLLGVVHVIYADDLVRLARAVDHLVGYSDADDPDGEAMATYTAIVCERVRHHNLVPAALGSRCESLEHKASAIAWACSLEQHSEEALSAFFQSTASITTDLGTEIALTDCRDPGWWQLFAKPTALQADDGSTSAPTVVDPARRMFETALPVAGVLHILTTLPSTSLLQV